MIIILFWSVFDALQNGTKINRAWAILVIMMSVSRSPHNIEWRPNTFDAMIDIKMCRNFTIFTSLKSAFEWYKNHQNPLHIDIYHGIKSIGLSFDAMRSSWQKDSKMRSKWSETKRFENPEWFPYSKSYKFVSYIK